EPRVSESTRERSAVPFAFPRACGLTMTPMPDTSGGRSGRGELAARRLDILAAALADGGVEPVPAQDRLECRDARARARHEAGAGERVEGNEVHLDAKPVQEPHEATRVRV